MLQELRRLASTEGYTTLRDDGIEKVKDGFTSIDALLEVVARKSDTGVKKAEHSRSPVWHDPSRDGD